MAHTEETTETEPAFVWRVTMPEGDKVTLGIEFGPKLSEAPFTDETKLGILGKSLINLGTRLLTSSVSEDDDDDDGDWDDED